MWKGKHQLSAELKDKEIISLKEELKSLQLFKYSLEKKLSELEQKLQLQTQAKDRHLSQLGEVEKRFRAISKQCTLVKQAHEKLEQNVEEAMRLNKKLTLINKKQESTIAALRKDLERLNSEMVKYKVVSICRSGQENSDFLVKEQQIKELTQKLNVETEVNKKLRNENDVERAEKQKLMSSLQHAQWLLQVQTQAVCRTEQQLLTHTEEYQMQMQKAKMQAVQEELKTVKVAYDHLHRKYQQPSPRSVHQAKFIYGLEDDLADSFNIQKNSPNNLNCDIHVSTAGNLSKDASLDTVGQISSQNDCEQMRHHKEAEDIPDERTAGCQEAAKDGCFHGENGEASFCSHTNRTDLVLPPSPGLDALAPDQSERSESISGDDVVVTNLQIGPVVKQEASVIKTAPVRGTFDNGCPLSVVQSYTDSCLDKISESETRSVYGVASDPLMSESRDRPEEQSLGVSEMRERQTSDKHTSETSQDGDLKYDEPRTTAPETNSSQSVLPNDSELNADRPTLPEENDEKTNPEVQDKDALKNQIKQEHQDAAYSSPPQQMIPQLPASQEKVLPQFVSVLDTTLRQSNKQFSHLQGDTLSRNGSHMQQIALEDVSKNANVTVGKSIPDIELNATASHSNSSSPNTLDITVNSSEDPGGNEVCEKRSAATSAQMPSDQKNADASPSPLISNLKDASCTDRLITQSDQLNDADKQLTNRPSYSDDSKGSRLSFDPSTSQKETVDKALTFLRSTPAVPPGESKNNPSASALPSGFQELLSSLNTHLFSRHKLRNRGASVITQSLDKLNVSSTHPDQRSDHHGEWNAIKQTFSEISVKKENRVPISFGSAQLGSPAARSMGNGLRHDCTPTPPPRLHSLGKVSLPVSEESPPTSLEKDDHHHSAIRAQIAKIEQFLASEGYRPEKRRRLEKCEVLKP
ncbi:coiled-coil domain-containing protein 73 isoform X1 [Salminus brasiliensis]|uniref:coiled-coil domain-containing protein 73 isoform X1 n=1 Tax=Salminus brasiliensis TaxID=930266 RepID=UPI003B831434